MGVPWNRDDDEYFKELAWREKERADREEIERLRKENDDERDKR